MTKQEFLAMSLPYQLWCKILDYKNDYVGHPFDLIVGINQWSKDGKLWSLKTLGGAKSSFDRALPVLRSLSDLTKPIEHKGEKFVPIVKLMEIAFGVEIDLSRVELSFKDDMYIAKINELEFGFDITDNSILSFMHNLPSCTPKQLLLFQKLIDWHFNLMDIGEEFIDVNTLEENPYK